MDSGPTPRAWTGRLNETQVVIMSTDPTPKIQGLWGRIRVYLILGRVSNLPTVWSNVVAGWLLAHGDLSDPRLWMVAIAGSLIYLSGMYWNDAQDVEFDTKHAPERPIPSGMIGQSRVWKLGSIFAATGGILMALVGFRSVPFALGLVASVYAYTRLHKRISWSPWLMASCRLFLLLAAAAAAGSVSQQALAAAFALASYIVGLSYFARRERSGGLLSYWPTLFLAAPLFLAGQSIIETISLTTLAATSAFILWSAFSLKPAFERPSPRIGAMVGRLLAGIPLVDAIAIAPTPDAPVLALLCLTALSFALQRAIPAT